MEIGDTKIPDEMLEVANNAFFKAESLTGQPKATDGERLGFALIESLRWLKDILHPRNVDFHRAILEAERKRFPGSDQDTQVIMRRVDFEYGVSFARNYLQRMFTSEPTKDERQADLIAIANKLMATPDWRSADLYHALLEAFRLGETFREKGSL
jgi:hypothetical protein